MDPRNERLIRRLDSTLFTEPEPDYEAEKGPNPVANYFKAKSRASGKAAGLNSARAAAAMMAARQMVTKAPEGPLAILGLLAGAPTALYGYTRGQRTGTNINQWMDNAAAAEMWADAIEDADNVREEKGSGGGGEEHDDDDACRAPSGNAFKRR